MIDRKAARLAFCAARYAVSRSMHEQGEWLGRLYPENGCQVVASRNMLWRAVRDYLGVESSDREAILSGIERIGFKADEFEETGWPHFQAGKPDKVRDEAT